MSVDNSLPMDRYILALDQGTTSSRAILFDKNGKTVAIAQKEFNQIFPQSGWVEHNPDEIWSSQISVATEVLTKAHIKADRISAIGITNQRETTVVWDKRTGHAVYNAIVWQDRRTSERCNALKEPWSEKIQQRTGLIIDSYFSATKIEWILNHVEGARKLAEEGHLAFGTIDSWLLWKLSNGTAHVTDPTNASRTMLYNIREECWDNELLELFSIPSTMLPDVKESCDHFALCSSEFLGYDIPITGVAGDQQAALFGQMCTQTGMVKNTYGTGCFMLMNIGNEWVPSNNQLLTTIAWKINGEINYALEGSVFIAGAVVQWLRDGLEFFRDSSEIESLARSVEHTDGVYIVPAFTGLGAPYWSQEARGTVVGLSRGTHKGHIARASLESIAYQTYDVLKAMEADSKIQISELRVDGGATANNLLMQFQSDILDADVVCPHQLETTALGAAYLAGLQVGFWDSIQEIEAIWRKNRAFNPKKSSQERNALLAGWQRALYSTQAWASYPHNNYKKHV